MTYNSVFSKEERDEIEASAISLPEEIFQMFDDDGDRFLNEKEYKEYLRALGINITVIEREGKWESDCSEYGSSDTEKGIPRDNFVTWFEPRDGEDAEKLQQNIYNRFKRCCQYKSLDEESGLPVLLKKWQMYQWTFFRLDNNDSNVGLHIPDYSDIENRIYVKNLKGLNSVASIWTVDGPNGPPPQLAPGSGPWNVRESGQSFSLTPEGLPHSCHSIAYPVRGAVSNLLSISPSWRKKHHRSPPIWEEYYHIMRDIREFYNLPGWVSVGWGRRQSWGGVTSAKGRYSLSRRVCLQGPNGSDFDVNIPMRVKEWTHGGDRGRLLDENLFDGNMPKFVVSEWVGGVSLDAANQKVVVLHDEWLTKMMGSELWEITSTALTPPLIYTLRSELSRLPLFGFDKEGDKRDKDAKITDLRERAEEVGLEAEIVSATINEAVAGVEASSDDEEEEGELSEEERKAKEKKQKRLKRRKMAAAKGAVEELIIEASEVIHSEEEAHPTGHIVYQGDELGWEIFKLELLEAQGINMDSESDSESDSSSDSDLDFDVADAVDALLGGSEEDDDDDDDDDEDD